MTNNYWLRLFGNAIARRVAFVLVALVLGFLGIGRAHASDHPDSASAFAHAAAGLAAANYCAQQYGSGGFYTTAFIYNDVVYSANSGSTKPFFRTRLQCSQNGTPVPASPAFGTPHTFPITGRCTLPDVMSLHSGVCKTPCASRPDMHILGWPMTANDIVCFDECEYVQLSASAGGGQAPVGASCTVSPSCTDSDWELVTIGGAPSSVCHPKDTDGDGVPDFEDDFPDDPGESHDTDGDGIGDGNDHAPNDPDDGADEEGEEDGDDEGDNVSHGGGSCGSPPISDGDGILVQIAFQAWKTRCAIEAAQNADGTLNVKGAGGSIGVGIGGGDGEGEQEAPDPNDYLGDGSGEEGAGAVKSEEEYGGDGFDQSGFGWSRSCPAPTAVSIFGHEVSFASANSTMCDWLSIGAYFVMLLAMIQSLRVLMSA